MKKRNQFSLCVGIISFLILGLVLLSTLCPVEEVCVSEHQEPIVEAFDVNKTINVTVEVIGALRTFLHFGNVVIQTASEVPKINFEEVPYPDKIAGILRESRIEEEKEKLEGRVR